MLPCMTTEERTPPPPPSPVPARAIGLLSQEQQQAAQAWLQEHWTIAICPFHGPTNWSIGATLVGTVTFANGGIVMGGGPLYPLLPVTCSVCGYTVFINALIAGLVSRPEPPTDPAG
jgi:hypothetical protein